MKWHRGAILLGALSVLALCPGVGYSGARVIERYATLSGTTTPVYHYTKGDTTLITMDIPCQGAKAVKIAVWTDYAVPPSQPDSSYSDSIQTIGINIAENDTNFVTILHNQTADGVLSYQPTQFDSSTTRRLGRTENGFTIAWLVPYAPTGTTAGTHPTVILAKRVKLLIKPKNRNTYAGSASTQGLRTRGFKGLTVKLTTYYDNP